jgi:glycerol-3-phosphate acyltransferase PlsX
MAQFTIALDAMGGDDAPSMVVGGVILAAERLLDTKFLLFGDKARLEPLLARHGGEGGGRIEIRHTDQRVSGDEKPSQALRKGRASSMGLAIEAVKQGEAVGAVSAGNTGALMALAKFALRMLPGIDRPAICTLLPTMRGQSVVLDLGANVECDAETLVQFAIMGEAFARVMLGIARPSIALLNVGSEEVKGHDIVREAAQRLRDTALPIDFKGFVEGDGIGKGDVDVIVTDGFTGNVALKTVEGTAKLIGHHLRSSFETSIWTKLSYLVARPAIEAARDHFDPRRYNGAMFVGLNGIVIKSHGGTDAFGFANAIGVAHQLAVANIDERITEDLRNFSAAAVGAAATGS